MFGEIFWNVQAMIRFPRCRREVTVGDRAEPSQKEQLGELSIAVEWFQDNLINGLQSDWVYEERN